MPAVPMALPGDFHRLLRLCRCPDPSIRRTLFSIGAAAWNGD